MEDTTAINFLYLLYSNPPLYGNLNVATLYIERASKFLTIGKKDAITLSLD